MGHSHTAPAAGETEALDLLESAQMRRPLAQAMRTLAARLVDWKLLQIHHRPGAGVSGIYEVTYQGCGGNVGVEYLCATTAHVGETTTPVVRLQPDDDGSDTDGSDTGGSDDGDGGAAAIGSDGSAEAGRDGAVSALTLWRHPLDPLLPGLARACDADAVGAEIFGRPGSCAQLSTVSYRPLRRAVIRAVLDDETAYLKVLRRGQGELLWLRHQLLAEAGIPVPVPCAEPADDVVALREVRGTPLANNLLDDGAQLLEPAALVRMLRRIPAAAMDLPARPAWALRAGDYAVAAAAALPHERSRIMNIAARIMGLLPTTDPGPLVPSHGDFYEANLLVRGEEITGLLDVDAVGPGLLVDDLACFIGHLAVLPAVDMRYVHIPAALDRFLTAFDAEVDPAGLRIRAAGVALSLVAGAKRSGSSRWHADALGRLAAAEQLAGSAVEITASSFSESSLIPASFAPHIQPAS